MHPLAHLSSTKRAKSSGCGNFVRFALMATADVAIGADFRRLVEMRTKFHRFAESQSAQKSSNMLMICTRRR
jgi:hypothetical protein